eukprot:68325_1
MLFRRLASNTSVSLHRHAFSNIAQSYVENRLVFGSQEIERIISNHFNKNAANVSILDAGCGIGNYCDFLCDKFDNTKIVGIDINPDMINTANKLYSNTNKNITFEIGDMMELPFIDNTFDVVLISQCLHHLSEPIRLSIQTTISEARRVLNDNGLLIIIYTRLSQRKHSYWHFSLFPDTVWQKLIFNDRWACFEVTDTEESNSLYDIVTKTGFKSYDMLIPNESHWYNNNLKNIMIDSIKVDNNWKLSEGCFNYMSKQEVNEFDKNVKNIISNEEHLHDFINKINTNRSIYGEGTVHCYKKIDDTSLITG